MDCIFGSIQPSLWSFLCKHFEKGCREAFTYALLFLCHCNVTLLGYQPLGQDQVMSLEAAEAMSQCHHWLMTVKTDRCSELEALPREHGSHPKVRLEGENKGSLQPDACFHPTHRQRRCNFSHDSCFSILLAPGSPTSQNSH